MKVEASSGHGARHPWQAHLKGWNPSHVPMAQKIDLIAVRSKFPVAREHQIRSMDPFEVAEMDREQEYWEHDGRLYARTWWPAQGWHYSEWTGKNWKCPDSGESHCSWKEGE